MRSATCDPARPRASARTTTSCAACSASALEREGLTVRADRLGHRGGARRSRRRRPTCSCSTSGCPTPTGATSARRCAPAASRAPVLFLTARDAVTDRLSGFHAGGDDYLTKPFALAELLVRVQALLRRGRRRRPAGRDPRQRVALDPAAHAVRARRPGERADADGVPPARRAGRATRRRSLRRAELVAAAWPDGAIVHDNTLDAYIARIRRKLRDVGRAARRSRRCAASDTGCGDVPTRLLLVSLLTLAVGPRRAARRRQRAAARGRARRRPTASCAPAPRPRSPRSTSRRPACAVRESANDDVARPQRLGPRRRPRRRAPAGVSAGVDRAAVALGRAATAVAERDGPGDMRLRAVPVSRPAPGARSARSSSATSSSRSSTSSTWCCSARSSSPRWSCSPAAWRSAARSTARCARSRR